MTHKDYIWQTMGFNMKQSIVSTLFQFEGLVYKDPEDLCDSYQVTETE